MAEVIARWESVSGKWYVEMDLFIPREGDFAGVEMYGYRSSDSCGSLKARNREDAFAEMEAKVASGQFLPDAAKKAMRRVA